MERGLSADAPMEPCWHGVIDRFIEKKTTNEFQTLLVAIFSSVICIFNCIYKYKQTGSTSLDDCFDAFTHRCIQGPESATLNKL